MLVLFNHLFGKRVGSRFFSSNSNLSLSSIQQEILVGGLLGDLSLTRGKPNHNARLAVRHSTGQTDYANHLFEVFKAFCTPNLKPVLVSFFDKRTNQQYFNISFFTRSLPCFNYYRDLFYPNGVKVVPSNIGEILTARGLAYWAMDDGYKDRNAFRFATESFSLSDVELLIKVMKENFDLDCSINTVKSKYYRIYVSVHSMDKFRSLVSPFFIPSMMYKLS